MRPVASHGRQLPATRALDRAQPHRAELRPRIGKGRARFDQGSAQPPAHAPAYRNEDQGRHRARGKHQVPRPQRVGEFQLPGGEGDQHEDPPKRLGHSRGIHAGQVVRGSMARNSFRLIALASEPFQALFSQSDAELGAQGIRRMVVDEKPGAPCRVSLADAEVGETVLLLNFAHHDVPTPYRGSGPIFVRAGARTAMPAPGEIPEMFRHRLLSVRAYDADAMLVASEVVQGTELEAASARFLADESVNYLHLHEAKPGCYDCRVERA